MAVLARRKLIYSTFDQLIGDVRRLRNGYDRVGVWSLEQALDHLTLSMTTSLDGKHGLPRPVRWLMRPILVQMLRTRSMPRVPAPKSLRPPAEVTADVFVRFFGVVDQIAALTAKTIDHPAFGRISLSDFQRLHLIHASRHLSFLVPHPPTATPSANLPTNPSSNPTQSATLSPTPP